LFSHLAISFGSPAKQANPFDYPARPTVQILPTYRYGMDLTGAFSGRNGPRREPLPQLAILEHRRDLEKCLVVRRLREQVCCELECETKRVVVLGWGSR